MPIYTYKTIRKSLGFERFELLGFDGGESSAGANGIFDDCDEDSICVCRPGTYCVMYSFFVEGDGCIALYLNGSLIKGSRKNGKGRLDGQSYVFLQKPVSAHLTVKNCGREVLHVLKGCLIVFAV